jgi:hypothetical protein
LGTFTDFAYLFTDFFIYLKSRGLAKSLRLSYARHMRSLINIHVYALAMTT